VSGLTMGEGKALSRGKVEPYIAEQEREIEVLRATRDRIQDAADDVHRELLGKESQLANFRALVEQRGLVDP
jgi:hypothetical protein